MFIAFEERCMLLYITRYPSCLLTVWTESSLNPETCLSHDLPLSGIDCKRTKMYVCRFLEKGRSK